MTKKMVMSAYRAQPEAPPRQGSGVDPAVAAKAFDELQAKGLMREVEAEIEKGGSVGGDSAPATTTIRWGSTRWPEGLRRQGAGEGRR